MRKMDAAAVAVWMAVAGSAAAAQTADPALEQRLPPGNERVDRFTAVLFAELLDTLELEYAVEEGRYGQPAITVTGSLDAGGGAQRAAGGFEVQFFGCDAEGLCDEVSLISRYTPIRPTTLTTVNRFNQGTRFTTAYTGTNGDLILSMDISAVGGIGRRATMMMIAIYVFNMESFATAIGYS